MNKNNQTKKYIDIIVDNENNILNKLHEIYTINLKDEKFVSLLNKLKLTIKNCSGIVCDLEKFDNEMKKYEDKNISTNDYELISSYNYNPNSNNLNIYNVAFSLFVETILENKENSDFETINRFKLLYHYFDDERFEQILSIYINTFDNYKTEDLSYDIFDLNNQEKKAKFLMAISKNEKEQALELLHSINNDSERNYFKGLIYYKDAKYEKALIYLNHESISKNSADIKAILTLKLLCYAHLGDLKKFNKTAKKIKKIGYNLYLYGLLLLILNSNEIENFEEKNLNFSSTDEYFYEYLNLVMKVIIEIYLRIDDCYTAAIVSNNEFNADDAEDIIGTNMLNALFSIVILVIQDESYFQSIFENNDISVIKTKLISIVYTLIKNKLNDNIVIYKYLLFLHKMDEMDMFVKIGIDNVNTLIKNARFEFDIDAKSILKLLYIEMISRNQSNSSLEKYINKNKIEIDSNDISNIKIQKLLSPKGKKAFIAAEWIFEQSKLEDYGWKDAGSIALSFYKIIELEFNQYICKIFNVCTYKEIEKQKESIMYKNINKKEADALNKKWNTIMREIKKEHLTLGSINYLMKNILEEKDELSNFLEEKLFEALKDEFSDIELLFNLMKEYSSDDYRNKYRNPPAHAEYLPYDIACECRNIVIDLFANKISKIMEKQDVMI